MTLSPELIEKATFTALVDKAGNAAWNNACHWSRAHGPALKTSYRAMIGSAIAAVLPDIRKEVLEEAANAIEARADLARCIRSLMEKEE